MSKSEISIELESQSGSNDSVSNSAIVPDVLKFQSKDNILENKTDKSKEKLAALTNHGHAVTHPTTYLESLMHLFKGNVGSGIFAMGDAIKNSGIIVGPSLILVIGTLCLYCQHQLLTAAIFFESKLELDHKLDYPMTMEKCFENGPKKLRKFSTVSRKVVDWAICVTQFGLCCVYFLFISDNTKHVLDHYGYEVSLNIHMAVILAPILLTCLIRNLKFLAPFSALANCLIICGLGITLYYTVQDLPSFSTRNYVASVTTMPLFFGTAIFAFEGIGLVLPLHNEMKHPENFRKTFGVMNVGMVIVTIFYATMGTICFLQYGDKIDATVTSNLPEGAILAQVCKIIISVGILFTYAVQFYVGAGILWSRLESKYEQKISKNPVIFELTFRAILVLITFALAEIIPFLSLFISLVGSLSGACITLIFPPIIEILMKYYSESKISAIDWGKCLVVFLFGLLGCITGTYTSIFEITKAFQGETKD